LRRLLPAASFLAAAPAGARSLDGVRRPEDVDRPPGSRAPVTWNAVAGAASPPIHEHPAEHRR